LSLRIDGCESIATTFESLPTNLAAAHALILARLEAETAAASAKAEAASAQRIYRAPKF